MTGGPPSQGARGRPGASTWASLLVLVLLGAVLYRRVSDPGPFVGKPAPDFSLHVVAGEGAQQQDRIRLSDLKGHTVVLDFWASWCEPCRQSVPILNRVEQELGGQGVRVIGVNSQSLRPDALARIAQRWGFGYPVLHDPDSDVMVRYDINALPTLFLIDKQGVVRRTHAGSPSAERLIQEVREIDR